MTRLASAFGNPQSLIVAMLAGLAAVLCGLGIALFAADAPATAPYWLLITILGVATVATIVWAIRTDQLLTPIGIVALTFLVYFVVRPTELAFSREELINVSFNYFASPLDAVLTLSGQEITLYVHTRMTHTFDVAMTRAMAVLTLFFTVVVAAYFLPVGRHLAARFSQIGSGMRSMDFRWVVGIWLVIGLIGQVLLMAKIGGPAKAVTQLGTQQNLAVNFGLLVLLNFYSAGLLLWMCWHPPKPGIERFLLLAVVAEIVVFYALLGSRTLVLTPILLVVLVWNETQRPWRLRTLAVGAGVAILFSSAYLTLRQGTRDRPIAEVITDVPEHAIEARAILGASPVFDQLFIETDYIPAASPYRHGGELSQGVRGQIPRVADPSKPESVDESFRKLIWGETFLAGRPVGAAGEFYRDFGFPGVIGGAFLFGIFLRALTGLRARAGPPDGGRPMRVALFVTGLMVVYLFTVGSYSLMFGSLLAIAIPLTLALGLFGRRV